MPKPDVPTAASAALPPNPPRLNWVDAFGVSLRTLIRLEVPVGSRWVPSENVLPLWQRSGRATGPRYSTYATIHMILGWIIIPFVAASIAARLGRRSAG